MFLSELGTQTTVQMQITIEERQFEFKTTVQMQRKNQTLFEPIRKDNKLLNVQKEEISVTIILTREEGKPVAWQNVDVECVRYKGKIYYSVRADSVGKNLNRRGAYRLGVGEQIILEVAQTMPAYTVILKDLSSSGFSFIFPKEIKGCEDSFVHTKFVPQLNGQDIEIPLYGKVVRKMKLEDGRMLYGCGLVKKNELIGYYINQKQVEQLSRKNESIFDKRKRAKAL